MFVSVWFKNWAAGMVVLMKWEWLCVKEADRGWMEVEGGLLMALPPPSVQVSLLRVVCPVSPLSPYLLPLCRRSLFRLQRLILSSLLLLSPRLHHSCHRAPTPPPLKTCSPCVKHGFVFCLQVSADVLIHFLLIQTTVTLRFLKFCGCSVVPLIWIFEPWNDVKTKTFICYCSF